MIQQRLIYGTIRFAATNLTALSHAQQKMKQVTDAANQHNKQVKASANSAQSAARTYAAWTLALWGTYEAISKVTGGLEKQIKEIDRQTAYIERSTAAWTALLGKYDDAKKRLDFLQRFAVETPFNLEGVEKSALLLQAYGEYSERAMMAASDLAATFRREVEDGAQAIALAGEGLTRSLKLFGISSAEIMRELGESGVKLTADVTANGSRVVGAVLNIIERRYGGMSREIMKTTSGLIENIEDEWTRAQREVGAQGYEGFKREFLKGFLDTLNDLRDSGYFRDLGIQFAEASKGVFGWLFDRIEEISKSLQLRQAEKKSGIKTKGTILDLIKETRVDIVDLLGSAYESSDPGSTLGYPGISRGNVFAKFGAGKKRGVDRSKTLDKLDPVIRRAALTASIMLAGGSTKADAKSYIQSEVMGYVLALLSDDKSWEGEMGPPRPGSEYEKYLRKNWRTIKPADRIVSPEPPAVPKKGKGMSEAAIWRWLMSELGYTGTAPYTASLDSLRFGQGYPDTSDYLWDLTSRLGGKDSGPFLSQGKKDFMQTRNANFALRYPFAINQDTAQSEWDKREEQAMLQQELYDKMLDQTSTYTTKSKALFAGLHGSIQGMQEATTEVVTAYLLKEDLRRLKGFTVAKFVAAQGAAAAIRAMADEAKARAQMAMGEVAMGFAQSLFGPAKSAAGLKAAAIYGLIAGGLYGVANAMDTGSRQEMYGNIGDQQRGYSQEELWAAQFNQSKDRRRWGEEHGYYDKRSNSGGGSSSVIQRAGMAPQTINYNVIVTYEGAVVYGTGGTRDWFYAEIVPLIREARSGGHLEAM